MVAGCAGRKTESSVAPAQAPTEDPSARSEGRTISTAAKRIYMLGETRYAEGRFDEAVALWGHAMLQLPADPSADPVRHKLLARMGYGLLQANAATGDPSYLVDGQAMCELYLEQHEALFGDTDKANAERGEIYELLYEFDSRIDLLETGSDEADTTESDEPSDAASETTPDRVAQTEPDSEPSDEEGEVRLIRVRSFAWADPDDPTVRAFLRDDRFTGPSMLDWSKDQVNEARVLVRAGAVPRALGDSATLAMRRAAREQGMAVIEQARPALARCYEVAVTRDFVPAVRVELELTVATDGVIQQPRLSKGGLVDAMGDVCMAQALRDVKLPDVAQAKALSVWLPIHFFFQDATMASELSLRSRGGSNQGYEGAAQKFELGSIEAFAPSAGEHLLIVAPPTTLRHPETLIQ